MDNEAEMLTRKAIELALSGDLSALRLCLDRIVPPRRDRPIKFAMPDLTTVEDAKGAIGKIAGAVGSGELNSHRSRRTIQHSRLDRSLAIAWGRRAAEAGNAWAQTSYAITLRQSKVVGLRTWVSISPCKSAPTAAARADPASERAFWLEGSYAGRCRRPQSRSAEGRGTTKTSTAKARSPQRPGNAYTSSA